MLIKYILLFTSIFILVNSFNILPYYQTLEKDKEFYLCDNFSDVLRETTKEIFKQLNKYNLYDFQLNEEKTFPHEKNDINTICNLNLVDKYGYTTHYAPDYTETDISISNTLIGIDTNLYNVILHEVLHSIGLDHSLEFGIMNYTVFSLFNGIKKDLIKLYLSVDDFNGMKFLFDENHKNETEYTNETDCNPQNIIDYIKNCFMI